MPPAGARSVACKSCSRVLPVPDPAAVGIIPASAGAPTPAPLPAPTGRAPEPHRPVVPVFESDARLNLVVLEREAARQGALGTVVLLGGVLGAAAAPFLLPGVPALRIAAAAGILFVAVAGWSGLRAARASCLASVALAQRQAEIVRGLARGTESA